MGNARQVRLYAPFWELLAVVPKLCVFLKAAVAQQFNFLSHSLRDMKNVPRNEEKRDAVTKHTIFFLSEDIANIYFRWLVGSQPGRSDHTTVR